MLELYKITAPNGFLYIGASNDARRRWIDHKSKAINGSDCELHKAIRTFGWKNFKKEILVIGEDDYIYDLEIKAIEKFKTMTPFGYNMTSGGKISPMAFDAICKKVGLSKSGKKQPDRGVKFKNDGNPMFGKTHSLESLEKMKMAFSLRSKRRCIKCQKDFFAHTYDRHTKKCEVVS